MEMLLKVRVATEDEMTHEHDSATADANAAAKHISARTLWPHHAAVGAGAPPARAEAVSLAMRTALGFVCVLQISVILGRSVASVFVKAVTLRQRQGLWYAHDAFGICSSGLHSWKVSPTVSHTAHLYPIHCSACVSGGTSA